MLSFNEEVSGYDIKRWADWSIGHFYWSPSFSQVYSELKRLEKLGLARSRTVSEPGERSRRLYAITDEGLAASRQWVSSAPVDPPMLKHPMVMRIWLGHMSSPTDLKARLREYLDDLERVRAQVAGDAELARSEAAWSYPRLALEWAHAHYETERDLTLRLIDSIDETQRELAPALHDDGRLIPPAPGRWQEVGEIGKRQREQN
ncbi:hypothetical protein SCNU_19015 [Gordonia neofelifaecis NRRL B-59395]|uniref:Transcription regulator PadR N-terminal domain-containing protein n=2 Tax=Gordonia TaxID=2053 RepID=F1YPE8_9ACTN|nr:hypothetical protein SCNU_19015 [Gordonia neofelifaecis NRRL B-59395]